LHAGESGANEGDVLIAMRLYMGLVHYPVYNKRSERIASAITNFDLHDLSRLARTYGVRRLFAVIPLKDQQILAERIIKHWTEGYGAVYNAFRKEALELISVFPSLEECIGVISKREGSKPVLIATDASRPTAKGLSYTEAREMVASGQPLFVLFGTAWGLDEEILERADYLLDPIESDTGYNHLSVRSAAAIILDRLAGKATL
jgi:tRNA (guanine37-N1)-methyltransferase